LPSQTYREVDLTFERGMNTQYEASLIPDGSLTLLENWVPEETKGVRVRQGWKPTPTTGGPATSKGIGLGTYSKISLPAVRQRVIATNVATTATNIKVTWSKATKAGSTLVIIIGVSGNGNLQETTRNNYQVFHWTLNPAVSPQNNIHVFVYPNAVSETVSAQLFANNIGTGAFSYDAYELESVGPFGTPKNLFHSITASMELSITGNFQYWDRGISPGSGGPGAQTSLGKRQFGIIQTVAPNATDTMTGTTGLNGIPVTGSTNYVFSYYYAFATGGQNAGFTMSEGIKWYDQLGVLISTSTSGTTLNNTTSWTRFQFSATSPSNARYAAPFITYKNEDNTNNKQFYLDAFQFELGTTATGWVFGSIPPGLYDQLGTGADSTNPISLSVANPSLASVSWAQAIVVDFATSNTKSGWTNSYTEDTDFQLASGGGGQVDFATAHRVVSSSGVNLAVDVTESAAQSTQWVLFNLPFTYSTVSPERWYIAANDSTSALDIYYIDKATVDTASWNLLESRTLSPGGVPVAYANGLGFLIYTHPGMPFPRSWNGQGTTPTDVSAVAAGRCTAFFKTRFFIGGQLTIASRLFYSDIGDQTSWPATNFIDIGKDDGEPIDDIASTQNVLVVAKASGIWTLSGSGPDTFFLSQMPYGEAAPGRSIAVSPFGAIVAGKTAVWSVVSNTVENISRQIGPSYAPTGYVHTAYVDNKVYILDVDAKVIWVYDLTSTVWHRETMDGVNNQPVTMISDYGKRLMAQPKSSTDTGLFYYKDLPAGTRVRDFSPVTSDATLTTPVMWLGGAKSRITPRWLFLQLRQRGSGGSPDQRLRVETRYDGSSGNIHYVPLQPDSRAFRDRVDLGAKRGATNVQFVITGPSTGNQYDIEKATIGFDEEVIA
jgi:hypothetical protein